MQRLIWIGIAVIVSAGAWLAFRPQAITAEFGSAERRTVQEYIEEEAETRLDKDFLLDVPVSGTISGFSLHEGDVVEAGQVICRIVDNGLDAEISAAQAMVAQAEARLSSVDIQKPKPEDLQSANVGVAQLGEAVQIAQRELSIAQINQDKAQKDFARMQELEAEGVVSRSEFDATESMVKAAAQNLSRARLAAEAAEKSLQRGKLDELRLTGSVDDNEFMRDVYNAEISAHKARLERLQNDLAKSEVRSPVNGPILDKFVEDGRVLMAGTPIAKVGDLGSIEIASDILSEEIGRVKEGNPVDIFGKALGDTVIQGKVRRIYPAASPKISSLGIQQMRVKTIVSFDNSTVQLRPGTRLDVRVITNAHDNVLAVPERSTFRENNQWYIFKVEGGRAVKAPVTLGLRNDTWAEVVEGLSESDTIILEPKNTLADGVRVTKN